MRSILCAILVLTTAGPGLVRPEPALPYFDDATLTPKWLGPGESSDGRHRVGDFELLDQSNRRFDRSSVTGRIHVASFLFTSCGGICPQLVTRMKWVQAALEGDDTLLVSFSVDPERDTPQRLAAFGAERGIDPERWRLVTGERREVYAAARTSYFADDGGEGSDAESAFVHTERVVLVDAEGYIRGVYNGTLPLDMKRLVEDVAALREEAGRA